MLKTIDEACDFIAEWCQQKDSYAGPPLRTGFAVPDCVLRLNARVGHLWHSAKRLPGPILRYATPFLGLFGGQDEIVNPRDYARDKNGVVAFVRENQGVWRYGFDPDDVDQLLVSGDWFYGLESPFPTDWRRVPAQPQDALVWTLLINLCMQSNADWDEYAPKPEATHLVLWQHPAWTNFDGFWINDEKTLIYFGGGWRVTRK